MRRFALLALILLVIMMPKAWAGSIILVLSDDSAPYTEFSDALHDALKGSGWHIATRARAPSGAPASPRHDLIVTAGSQALRSVLASGGSTPIIATLLPRQSYEQIIADSPPPRPRLTAITLDQPASRQASFLRHLLPDHKRVGILLSEETKGSTTLLRQQLSAVGLSLDSESASDNAGGLLGALNALLPRVNVLLAQPDASIYKRDNIKAILVTSYRHQRPVVAYSAAFVKAGALAALYTTPTQIAGQTAELILGPPPLVAGAIPPSMFAISINQNVAHALGLGIPDEITIRQGILAERESR
jgi:ABC-type uncharacterized transport system substrate-binding protein